MENVLQQGDLETLSRMASGGHVASRMESAPLTPQSYNYSRAGQISTEQMRAISMLNDMFARNLKHNLGAWLRTRFEVNLVSAEQMAFHDFLSRIPELTYVGSVRLEPLGALSVLQLDLSLAPPMVDLLLGGEGRPGIVRELTDIEESILASVVEMVCRELSSAWQSVGLSFNFEHRQMQTQIERIMPVTEKTLCLSFEIRMPEAKGVLNLAFPAVVSNTILRRLTGDWEKQRRQSASSRHQMRRCAGQIEFGASLQLPSVRIATRDLENLEPGSVLRLALSSDSRSQFVIGGIPVFEAQPVSQGEHRAAYLIPDTGALRPVRQS
jgi:flagellar motor switch protein FliM